MPNPQNIEVKPAELKKTEVSAENDYERMQAEGNQELADRAEALIDRMARVYAQRLIHRFTTHEELSEFAADTKNPEWKRLAAKKALEQPVTVEGVGSKS